MSGRWLRLTRRPRTETRPPDVAATLTTAFLDLDHRQGIAQAAVAAAAALRPDNAEVAAKLAEVKQQLATTPAPTSPCSRHYCSGSTEKKKFVCLCEDVTEKDICDAIAEGYSNIETLKRYSTISMGPCQGKMCQSTSIALCARQNGVSIFRSSVPQMMPAIERRK